MRRLTVHFLLISSKNTNLKDIIVKKELLPKDPYRAINPWYPKIFRKDLPRLESTGMIERKNGNVKLTENGLPSLAS